MPIDSAKLLCDRPADDLICFTIAPGATLFTPSFSFSLPDSPTPSLTVEPSWRAAVKKAGRKGLSRRPAPSYPALSVPPVFTISAHSEQLYIAALCREYGGAPPHGSRPAARPQRRHQLPVSFDAAHEAIQSMALAGQNIKQIPGQRR